MYETYFFYIYIIWGEDYYEHRLILGRTTLGKDTVDIEDLEMSSLTTIYEHLLLGKTSHTLRYSYSDLKTMHLSDPYVA